MLTCKSGLIKNCLLLIRLNITYHSKTIQKFILAGSCVICQCSHRQTATLPLTSMWASERVFSSLPLSDDSHGVGILGMQERFSMVADFFKPGYQVTYIGARPTAKMHTNSILISEYLWFGKTENHTRSTCDKLVAHDYCNY